MIPPLILVPFVIRHLGESGYGEYALIWSLIMAIETLEISLQSGVIKYSAGYLAQNRIDDVNRVLSSTFVFSLVLGLLSCVLIVSSAFIKFEGSKEMTNSLVMVGIMMIFLVPTTPFQGIVMAKQRHYLRALIGVLVQYGGLILVIAWFKLAKPSVGALVAIMALTVLSVELPDSFSLSSGSRTFFQRAVAYMNIPLLDLKAQYQTIREEVRAAIDSVCESQHFILGPEVERLEQSVASYSGTKFAVGMSSGTDALLATLMALDIGPGDEVVTSPFTFFATAGTIARAWGRGSYSWISIL